MIEINSNIKFGEESSPIHDVLREVNVEANFLKNAEGASLKGNNGDAISYILQRLNGIEGILQNKVIAQAENNRNIGPRSVSFTYFVKEMDSDNINTENLFSYLEKKLMADSRMVRLINIFEYKEIIEVTVNVRRMYDITRIAARLKDYLVEFGFEEVEYVKNTVAIIDA